MKKTLITLPLLTVLALFYGCESFEVGVPQDVVVVSSPSGASVYVNGVASGVTPMDLSLPRKMTHEIRLERAGYNPAVKYFTPELNDKGKALIRFGLMEDLGYYHDLTPKRLNAEMVSEIVPTSTGPDPYERMAERALEADRKLMEGEITPDEHRQIIEQIIEFFEAQQQ